MSPDPPTGDGGDIAATPQRLCRLGHDLENQVGPHLQKALTDVGDSRAIGHALFTGTCYPFAAAYTEAVEFAEEDLQSKQDQLSKIRDHLCTNGYVWAVAEDKSTIKS